MHSDAPRALAWQTVVKDYLPPAARERYEAGMRDWLLRSEPGAALWAELELAPPDFEALPCTIVAHVRQGDAVVDLVLARCEPHPRAIAIHPEAIDALRVALRPG